ncbi:MAG: protein kinase domain-containing protein [Planctomycetota bacterium]
MNPDAASKTSDFSSAHPHLAGFRVIEPLAGAGSNVFKVRREADQELLAAKIFTGLSPAVAQTLKHNCEQAFLLSHPRLIPVLGTGRSGENFYILAEFVPGDSLATCLERWRRLPYPQTLDMITALAQALAYAHMHGMCHGTLSPRQVLVLERLEMQEDLGLRIGPDRGPDAVAMFDPLNVKIAGVGIGLPLESGERPAAGGSAPATPSWLYAAPERIAAKADPAPAPSAESDIYSLGCIFHQLLCGEPPFAAADLPALRLKHQSEIASLEALRALDLPEKAIALIGHMVDVDPAVRPSTYDALLEALSQLHADYHARLAKANAKPRRGGTSGRLSPVREASLLLSAPPAPARAYRTHFSRRARRGWKSYTAVALLSSLATAAGIVAGLTFLHLGPRTDRTPERSALNAHPNPSTPDATTAGHESSSAPDAAADLREAKAQAAYDELRSVVELASDRDLPTAILNLKAFEKTYAGTAVALKAQFYRSFLEKRAESLAAATANGAAPANRGGSTQSAAPTQAPDAADPRLTAQWEARRKQALDLAQAARYDEALKLVNPQSLPPELQTTTIMKSAADAYGGLYAEVGRAWSRTEQQVADQIGQRQFDAALLQLDLVIKTWGVDEFVAKAQELRVKVNTAQELDADHQRQLLSDRQKAHEAEAWSQQLYVIMVLAKKFQYDDALKAADDFRRLDLKNTAVKQEVDEAIETVALQKELLRRINGRLDKAKFEIEWKNQRLWIVEISERGVKGRTPEEDPDPKNPGHGVAYVTVPWTGIDVLTVYNNLFAYLLDTYQSDEHLMLAVFAHQQGLENEYKSEALVAAKFGDPAAQKVSRMRDILARLDARMNQAEQSPAKAGTPAKPAAPAAPTTPATPTAPENQDAPAAPASTPKPLGVPPAAPQSNSAQDPSQHGLLPALPDDDDAAGVLPQAQP